MKNSVFEFKKPYGGVIYCYGECEPYQNFDIACDNENYDGIWAGDDGFDGPYTWRNVCEYLLKNYRPDIVQLVAV